MSREGSEPVLAPYNPSHFTCFVIHKMLLLLIKNLMIKDYLTFLVLGIFHYITFIRWRNRDLQIMFLCLPDTIPKPNIICMYKN